VAHERARVNIPNDGNLISFKIGLRGFLGAIVRGDPGKFADDQRLNVRMRGFFVLGICAGVSDMRVGEADDLASVTRVSKNLLITGEAGIENDFATAAGFRSGGAACKNASVFERKVSGQTNLRWQRIFLRLNFLQSL
jgi:hypothetical protein